MDRLFRVDFYPQEWIIDTAMLTPDERGIYIQIVMMIYSNRGPIPFDEKHLANICNCSKRMVRSIIKILHEKGFIQFSGEKITQKRAEYELNLKRTHLELSSKGGRTKAENDSKNNKNKPLAPTEPQKSVPSSTATASPSPKDNDDVVRAARSVLEIGKQISEITGWANDPRWFGDFSRIEVWLRAGYDTERDIIPTITRIMKSRDAPPKSLKYFEQAIADSHTQRTQPLPKGNHNGKSNRKSRAQDLAEQADKLLDELGKRKDGEGGNGLF